MDFSFNNDLTILFDEPLSKHSSFKIGGLAKYVILPKCAEEMLEAIEVCRANQIKYLVVGNGSNLLFDDNGFDGAVIITKNMKSTEYIYKADAVYVKCECGKSLTELANELGKKHSLAGIEFAYGIPGTVGGAVFMNAGAYGGQMSDLIVETEYYDTFNKVIKRITNEEQEFSYRRSVFMSHPEYLIISTTLKLNVGNPEDIIDHMNKNMSARKEKQPLEYPNAGSIFKRPGAGLFAGKLIEDSGLKGYTVGGAQISEKHAGFIINLGNASCSDVLTLIEHTKNVVMEKFNVVLECEVIYVPK